MSVERGACVNLAEGDPSDGSVRDANLDKAIEDLNRVLRIDPNNGLACVERARIHLGRKEWAQADEYFSRALKLIQGDKEIWIKRAEARARQERTEAAITDYKEALRLDPEDASVHGKLAETYRNLKNWQKAIDEYDLAAANSTKQP